MVLVLRTLADAVAGHGRRRPSHPRAERARQPDGARCVPQDHLEPVLLRHLALARARPRRARHRGGRASTTPRTASGRLRDVAAAPRGSARATRRGGRRAQHRAAQRSASPCAGPTDRRRASGPVPRAAVGASRRGPLRPLRDHAPRGARASCCPPGAATGGSTGPCPGTGGPSAELTRGDRAGASGSAAGVPASSRASSGSAGSRSPRSSRSVSRRAARSSSATPPTASPRAAGRE